MKRIYLVCILVAALFGVAPFFAANAKEHSVVLPILMYHQISKDPSRWGTYVISPEELEADCALLSENGFETVSISDLIAFTHGIKPLPKHPVMITFDDGYESDYVYAYPILKRYGFCAVSSTVGSYTELYSGDVEKHINYSHLNWEEMREMQESGVFEFQNHSYNLHNYSNTRKGCRKSATESVWQYNKLIREDIAHSQRLFLEHLGHTAACFTYPFGSVDDRLREHIKAEGFLASLGVYAKLNYLQGDPEELFDLNRFNRTHGYDIRGILEEAKAPVS
ncbi:MAG: polysaccharide deacetylase family protein [Oscillospiraceae bacterium]|nr:polysaccharide deacetylase family protein [Oscillospiraceae bacterium]